jgi:vancomycin permeability regulator SanA
MKKRTRKRRAIIALGVALGLPLLGTAILFIAGLRDEVGKADVALVLGSKVERDGTPSARLRARLDRTLELYRAGNFSKIITSGGVGKEGFDEASVMRDYLVANGIPREHVIVDSSGTNTFASAKNTLQIAHQHAFNSVLVVSQYFHIPRAKMALHRFGISTVYTAHAHCFEFRDIYSSFREFFGYLSYLFRQYDSVSIHNAQATIAL